MSRAWWAWLGVVAGLAAVDLTATVHAHLTAHRVPGGPTVMPLNQLAGWASSVLLVVVAAMMVVTGIRNARTPRYRTAPRP